jgi:hypothetical protein
MNCSCNFGGVWDTIQKTYGGDGADLFITTYHDIYGGNVVFDIAPSGNAEVNCRGTISKFPGLDGSAIVSCGNSPLVIIDTENMCTAMQGIHEELTEVAYCSQNGWPCYPKGPNEDLANSVWNSIKDHCGCGNLRDDGTDCRPNCPPPSFPYRGGP